METVYRCQTVSGHMVAGLPYVAIAKDALIQFPGPSTPSQHSGLGLTALSFKVEGALKAVMSVI